MLADVYPVKYTIKLDDQNEDFILVYVYKSADEARQATTDQHYTITTLTNFRNYINADLLLVHFATDGDLEKYKEQLDEGLKQLR